ncbi:MAG: amidohydrolase [Clostridia bacterium]|nr:amidohydrolase [Clostridia bacterium]
MLYEKYLQKIEDKRADVLALSDAIWDHAEIRFHEFESSALLSDALQKEGFTVERGVAGIPTAFTAVFGNGHPAIGILAEFDALEGLSQKAGAVTCESIPGPDVGHGCGHNLFAGGSFAAALAVKAYVDETGNGSVTLFGCPAEESGAGKVYLAREGIFRSMDAVIGWHPENMYMVRTRPALANLGYTYYFKGIAAHAGGSPQKGRSALDAVELMNVGCNFLREHMDTTSRIHYAIVDAGGTAANVVQAHAAVSYTVRAVSLKDVLELHRRVDLVAKGAAMMTETTVTSKFNAGYSNIILIPTLQKTVNEALHDIPLPVPTEEDIAFGRALQETMNLSEEEKEAPVYADHVLDPAPPAPHGGSTDTADVSWNCPTVQIHIGTWVKGTPGHSWQAVAQGKSRYAHEAMLYAGKAVAGTAIRLMEHPELLEEAKKEHQALTRSGYICPIPPDVKPPV